MRKPAGGCAWCSIRRGVVSRPVTVVTSGAMSAGTATAVVLACTVRPLCLNCFIEVEKAFSTAALDPTTER